MAWRWSESVRGAPDGRAGARNWSQPPAMPEWVRHADQVPGTSSREVRRDLPMTDGEARTLAALSVLLPWSFGLFIVALLASSPDGPIFIAALVPIGLVNLWAMSFSLRMDWPSPFTRGPQNTQHRPYLRQASELLSGRVWPWIQALRWLGIAVAVGAFLIFVLVDVIGGEG